MVKLGVLLAMAPFCGFAAGPGKVVITEKASQMKRAVSDIANNLNDVPDWEMDYVVPPQDAARLKGLKVHVNILDKGGRRSTKYVTYISGSRISVRPRQVRRPWGKRELGDVGALVIVGQSG